jgi:hypothetical protein
MAFPLVVRAIRLAIEAVDEGLEEAAGTLGANRVWTFLIVTLPLILPGVIAGAILGFAKAMGRVRRDDHLRLQHTGRDADAAFGDLRVHAGPRRPGGGDAADVDRDRGLDGARCSPPSSWRRGWRDGSAVDER